MENRVSSDSKFCNDEVGTMQGEMENTIFVKGGETGQTTAIHDVGKCSSDFV
jgi:hypothetical protein